MNAAEAEMDADQWTIGRLLAWTRDYLHARHLDAPRLSAEILLAHALECERIWLYTHFEQVPAEAALARFRELVKKAAAGCPIAYLTGSKEFFSLTFQVTSDVLIPRPETEILVERAIAIARQYNQGRPAILDLGTGSGCIAVSLAKHLPRAHLSASDISAAALDVARRNAEQHGVAQRIEFRCGHLFEPWNVPGADGQRADFDIIVCNPPYVATQGAPLARSVREFEPAVALLGGPDGLQVIRAVVAQAPRWLASGGHLLLEVAYDQAPAVCNLLATPQWRAIVTYRDGAGYQRVVHGQKAQDGAWSPPGGMALQVSGQKAPAEQS